MATFKVSDESINRHGFRVLTNGINLENFKSNPVMLWMHSRGDDKLPIGRWENIRNENGELKADAVFDDTDDLAMKIANKVEKGFINMASIGIRPISLSDNKEDLLPGQKYATVTHSELLEISLVDIGSNRNAVRLFDEGGEELKSETEKTSRRFGASQRTLNEYFKLNFNTMKSIITKLGLADNSDEAVVLKVVTDLQTEVATLKDKNTGLQAKLADFETKQLEAQKAMVKQLVDGAIADKKITEAMRDTYTKLATADYETTAKAIGDLKGYTSLAAYTQSQEEDAETAKMKFSDWQKKNPKGLEQMKQTDPERFKLLFKKEYGVEPKIQSA